MMITASLKVADFDALKAGFDAHMSARAEASMDAKAFQNIDDPNNAIAVATVHPKKPSPRS